MTNNLTVDDIHELLAEGRHIALIWSIDDVQSIREELSDNQAWAVLQKCKSLDNGEHGIDWQMITSIADELFPNSDNSQPA